MCMRPVAVPGQGTESRHVMQQARSPLAFTTILAQVHISDEMRQADRLSKDKFPKGRGTGQTQAERGLRLTKSGNQEHKESRHRLT